MSKSTKGRKKGVPNRTYKYGVNPEADKMYDKAEELMLEALELYRKVVLSNYERVDSWKDLSKAGYSTPQAPQIALRICDFKTVRYWAGVSSHAVASKKKSDNE